MSTLLLVRHGQASFGAADYDRLSELGLRQSTLLGQALAARGLEVGRVVCGGMRRHRLTADGCLLAMGVTAPIVVDAGWDEYDHDRLVAAYEPRFADRAVLAAELVASDDATRAFQRIFAAAIARWVSGEHDGDYGESYAQFGARVAAALARLAEPAGTKPAATTLVFTSGGPISAVAGQLLQVPSALQLTLGWTLANSGVTKVFSGRDGSGWKLSTLNEHSHLEGHGQKLITYR
jgi:broad specificity phosphatase PhoE